MIQLVSVLQSRVPGEVERELIPHFIEYNRQHSAGRAGAVRIEPRLIGSTAMLDFHVLVEDFADFPSLTEMVRITIRLVVAALLGGVLGLERQLKGKAAGLRTHMVVAMGAALFVIACNEAGMEVSDASRVIQGVVTGIGFLGAGAILKHSEQAQVSGLTTASCIWLATAVGVSVGLGKIFTAIIAVVISLIILAVIKSPDNGENASGEGSNQTA